MASFNSVGRLVTVLCYAAVVAAQTQLTLEQASSRKPPEYTPYHSGETVTVQGIVPAPAVKILDYALLVIQNESGHGLTLDAPRGVFDSVLPGDVLEVTGTITMRFGLVVLRAERFQTIRSEPPPRPIKSKAGELSSFERLGTLITTDARVMSVSENSTGDVLMIGNGSERPIRVFLPRENRAPGLGEFKQGDRVSVTGFASQYSPIPPHNQGFQIVVGDATAVRLIEKRWIVSPEAILVAIIAAMVSVLLWWFRERELGRQRYRLHAITTLAEDLISAETPGEISRKLNAVLPKVLNISVVRLFLFNKSTQSLDRVPTPGDPEPNAIRIDSQIGGLSSAVALCFRNRAMLHVPDTRKSPLMRREKDDSVPVSILFVPMFAQQELLGVMTLKYEARSRRIGQDELAATQHLANQIAMSLKLQEQQSMREQLLRSEKMAAAGQLISGVANELKGPLDSITKSANKLMAHRLSESAETELREIAFQAHRGAEIVSRLVSFSRSEQTETRPLDVNTLIGGLMDFREREWALKLVHARNLLPADAYLVLGDRAQLEQVMLNLLVHAEQSVSASPEKTIQVSSRIVARRILIAIDYSDRSGSNGHENPFDTDDHGDAVGLQVCQAIVQSHGGEIRLIRNLPTGSRFEVELPQYQAAPAMLGESEVIPRQAARMLTVLVVEPDVATQRKLLAVLAGRGHRAVPVPGAEEAIELAHRLRFDVTFCSVRLPGLNWVEFYEKIRRQIGTFVLLAEGYDSDLTRAFKGGEGYLLSKPLEDNEVQRLLATIEERQESPSRK